MVFKALLLLAASVQPNFSFAQDGCPGAITSFRDALKCAEGRSPEVQRALLELERARKLVDAAGQWKNPELSADSVSGKVGTERSSETVLSLGVPIELGGKISARTLVAEGGVARAEASLFEARAKIRAAAILKLHRLRQLLHEQEGIDESISTFSKLVTQFSKRLKLSPEQELSTAVFKMSKSEYELKKIESLDELAALDSYFKVSLGTSTALLKNNLPQSPKNWPELTQVAATTNSPRVRQAEAEVNSAQAELSLARSESWPTITLGPSLKLQTEAGRSDTLYGFNISFPIPAFNANGAGKAAAAAGLTLAETNKTFISLETEKTREALALSYKNSVGILAATLSHQDIEKKHSEIERLFLRGIVPSSLVIEAHRTFVELERARNERELKALDALMTIYTFDGKSPELIQ